MLFVAKKKEKKKREEKDYCELNWVIFFLEK